MAITTPTYGAFRDLSSAEQDHGADAMRIRDWCRERAYSIVLRITPLVVVVLSMLFAGGMPALTAEELDFGMVSDSPSKMIKRFAPLHDYLRSKGLPMGKMVSARSVDEMIDLLEGKKVDFVFESPYGATQIMDATGAVPVLIREKDGIKTYNSVIFVNNSSAIENFKDLLGKVVAFEDQESTSSYILPRTLLLNAKLELIESTKPIPNKVAYYFSRGDENVLAHVKLGRADAGGIDRGAVAELPQFRILSPESGYVPRHVLLVRDGVDYDGLKEALLNMAADPHAADVLTAVETPTGFSAFEGDPREIMDQVRASLGP